MFASTLAYNRRLAHHRKFTIKIVYPAYQVTGTQYTTWVPNKIYVSKSHLQMEIKRWEDQI